MTLRNRELFAVYAAALDGKLGPKLGAMADVAHSAYPGMASVADEAGVKLAGDDRAANFDADAFAFVCSSNDIQWHEYVDLVYATEQASTR